MAQDLTSVQWSGDQGLGDPAKEQARTNIGAVGVKTNDGSIPPTITPVNEISINTNNKRVMCDNQQIGLLIPEPITGQQNYVLYAGYAGSPGKGWAEWRENKALDPEDWASWDLMRSQSSPNAYSILATQFMSSSDEDVNEFFGIIGIQTDDSTSGNFSLVPCDKDGNYLSSLGSQCINIGQLPDNKVHHFGFYFKSSTTDKVRYIGVKGDSGKTVNITQLMIQKR